MTDTRRTGWRALLARLENPGLSRGQERVLNIILILVLVVFAGGWGIAIARTAAGEDMLLVGRNLTTNPLAADAPPPAAFVLDGLLRMVTEERDWRGESGAVRAIITQPGDTLALADTLGLDSLPAGASLEVQQVDTPGVRAGADAPGERPGAWNVLVRARDQVRRVADVAVLSPVPTEMIRNGRLGQYLIGEWPTSGRTGQLASPAYDPPRGVIRVTPSNADLPVSEHLVLGDFLTKGQDDVWPKYVVVSPRILDKLELTFQELERRGHPVDNVGIISGFRTPQYNAHGGSTAGRGSLSRHMYGDAMDFYIDNDRDGGMDDLNGDGRVDRGDAKVIVEAGDAVEKSFPQYVGGIGIYGPNPGAHSGFVHIDARGYRARW